MTAATARRGALGLAAMAALVVGALLLAFAVRDRALAASVSIGDNFFSPNAVTVPVGEAVTWTNTGALPHTATGAGFDSGILSTGGSFSFTPTAAGTIQYSCTVHPEMVGSITVTAAGGGGGGGGGGDTGGGTGGGTTAPPATGFGGTLDDGSNDWLLIMGGAALVMLSGLTAVYLARPRD